MVAALLAAAVLIPAGFHEAKVLEPAASYVAGKPAHIYCANSSGAWNDYATASGLSPQANGYTPTGSESAMPGDVCSDLLVGRTTASYRTTFGFASALLILVHESIHQRGVSDEAKTECSAIHEMPRVAVLFFHVKPGRQLRTMMAQAWVSHREKPAAYQSVC